MGCGDRWLGGGAGASDREVKLLVHRAIADATSDQVGITVGSIQVSRGWGDILFVKVQARMRDRSAQAEMEQRILTSIGEALKGQRSAASVTWVG